MFFVFYLIFIFSLNYLISNLNTVSKLDIDTKIQKNSLKIWQLCYTQYIFIFNFFQVLFQQLLIFCEYVKYFCELIFFIKTSRKIKLSDLKESFFSEFRPKSLKRRVFSDSSAAVPEHQYQHSSQTSTRQSPVTTIRANTSYLHARHC